MGNRRVALKPHAARIRRWVDEGRGDDWIATKLNTTPFSLQSLRSRNSIYSHDPVHQTMISEHPVVLDENEIAIVLVTEARDYAVFVNEWRDYLRRNPEDLQIVVTQDRIYLEKVR